MQYNNTYKEGEIKVSEMVYDEFDEELATPTEKKAKKSKKKEKALKTEYDETFSGEEKVLNKLANIKSEIKVEMKEIDIDDIVTSNFKKISRSDSVTGLAGVVAEWGVISPIHVLALEDEDTYQLLDGLRRVFAALRSGSKTIQAMVWDFTDKTEGKELANILALMVNRTQEYTPKEQWEQMKILESVNEASPGLIEYLLQMEAGDAMKLKDVMLADNSYSEYREGLLFGKYSIEQAYKKLCNQRKKEDKLEKEDNMSLDQDGLKESSLNRLDGYSESSDDDDENEPLGINEVKELLELGNAEKTAEEIEDMDIEELDKTNEVRGNVVQDTKNRTYIDSAVKQNTLIRDDFKCRACGLDGKSGMYLGILVYHHLVPVYAGGPDTVENGLTLCSNCHLTLHNYIAGKVQVNKEMLTDDEEKIFKNIFHFGNIAIEAQKKQGLSKKQAKELDAPSRQHKMPGHGLKDNMAALAKAESEDKETEKNIETED